MSKRIKLVVVLLAASSLSGACVSANARPEPVMMQERCIAREAEQSGFNGVISVATEQGAISVATGTMNDPANLRMTSDAQFNIGSAGKMWTAIAIGQLIDAGKVSLNDEIGRYVDGLTPEANAVTVRHLLTHSSGLGNFFTPENLEAHRNAQSLSDLKRLVSQERPDFAPGSRVRYSNTGFLLLGLLIEQVSGKSYATYLRDHIFTPASMVNSGVIAAQPGVRAVGMTTLPELDDQPAPLNGSLPSGPPQAMLGPPPSGGPGPGRPALMRPTQPPIGPTPMGPLRISPEAAMMGSSAGGTYSTASDMHRFFTALRAGRLTSASMRDALTSPQVELLAARGPLPAVRYGYGFALGQLSGKPWYGHNGGAPGINVATATFPAEQVTAIVMTNRDPPSADMMMRRVAEIMFNPADCGS